MAAGKDYDQTRNLSDLAHLIGVRQTLVGKNPGLPAAVFKAFDQSKKTALEQLTDVSTAEATLPFVEVQLKAARG